MSCLTFARLLVRLAACLCAAWHGRRRKKSSSQETFENIEWEYFNATGLPDTTQYPTSENTISGIVEKQSAYQELKYSVQNLPEFSSFGIKIVMRSDDPVYVPKIQDLRTVASY